MNRLFKLMVATISALLVAFSMASFASTASASPSEPMTAESLVQNVHFCHRGPRVGPRTGIVHRHVGPYCEWVRARRGGVRGLCRRARAACLDGCLRIGAPFPRRCVAICLERNAPRCL